MWYIQHIRNWVWIDNEIHFLNLFHIQINSNTFQADVVESGVVCSMQKQFVQGSKLIELEPKRLVSDGYSLTAKIDNVSAEVTAPTKTQINIMISTAGVTSETNGGLDSLGDILSRLDVNGSRYLVKCR